MLVILAEMYLDRTGDAADLDKEVFKVNRVERDGAIRRIGSGGQGRQLAAEAKPKQRDFAVAKRLSFQPVVNDGNVVDRLRFAQL